MINPGYLDSKSLFSLGLFLENKNDRELAQKFHQEVPKRVLLTVVTDENGKKHLEYRNQNSPLWGFKDTLQLIFTNKYKLKNVVKFLENKKLEDKAFFKNKHVVEHIVSFLDKKVEHHNNKISSSTFLKHLSKKISTTWSKTLNDQLKSLPPKQQKESPARQTIVQNTITTRSLSKKPQPQKPSTQQIITQKINTKEMSSEELRTAHTQIDSRKRAHNPEAVKKWGAGMVNGGNACYTIAIVQALRFSPISKRHVAILDPKLNVAFGAMQKICTLDKQNQNVFFEKLMDVVAIKRNRLKNLNVLKTHFVERGKQGAFSIAVAEVLKLPEERQKIVLGFIQDSLQISPKDADTFIQGCTASCNDAEKEPVSHILTALAHADDAKKATVRDSFMQSIASGEQAKKTLDDFLEKHDLQSEKVGIMQFCFCNTEDREQICKAFIRQELKNIHAETTHPSSLPVSSTRTDNLRQLLRLSGLDAETATSQEDAALLCRTLLELLGIDPVHFNVHIKYEKLFGIPSVSLESQTAHDTVVLLSIKDADTNTTFSDLIHKNRVQEEIDPQAMANTEDATMQNLRRGKALTPEEKVALRKAENKQITTTQRLCFSTGQKPPALLPLQVKRYEFNLQTGEPEKLYKKIIPSHALDIAVDGQKETVPYALSAVSVHSGSTPRGGHYYTYIPKVVDGKHIWLEYNDSQVFVHDTPDDIKKVELDIQINGYVYFYTQKRVRPYSDLRSKIRPSENGQMVQFVTKE